MKATWASGRWLRWFGRRIDTQRNDIIWLICSIRRKSAVGLAQRALPSIHAIRVRVATPDPPFGISS